MRSWAAPTTGTKTAVTPRASRDSAARPASVRCISATVVALLREVCVCGGAIEGEGACRRADGLPSLVHQGGSRPAAHATPHTD